VLFLLTVLQLSHKTDTRQDPNKIWMGVCKSMLHKYIIHRVKTAVRFVIILNVTAKKPKTSENKERGTKPQTSAL
jgi:hypothetical protein